MMKVTRRNSVHGLLIVLGLAALAFVTPFILDYIPPRWIKLDLPLDKNIEMDSYDEALSTAYLTTSGKNYSCDLSWWNSRCATVESNLPKTGVIPTIPRRTFKSPKPLDKTVKTAVLYPFVTDGYERLDIAVLEDGSCWYYTQFDSKYDSVYNMLLGLCLGGLVLLIGLIVLNFWIA
jgi:hypothetical protein